MPMRMCAGAAIEHLPYLEDERALPILIEALQNEAPRVRAAAAQALAQSDDAVVITHLIAALNDSDSWVQYFAARSIGRQGDSTALGALNAIGTNRCPEPRAYRGIGGARTDWRCARRGRPCPLCRGGRARLSARRSECAGINRAP